MGENREIQKGVWEGRIPVVFRLSEEDTDGERPEPVYVSVVVLYIIISLFNSYQILDVLLPQKVIFFFKNARLKPQFIF